MWKKAERYLTKDTLLKSIIKKHKPCTITPSKKKDYFEDLVKAIIFQQLSGKAANTIYTRFKDKINKKITPENILKIRMNSLKSCGVSRQKATYIKDLSKKIKDGELEIKKLDKLTDEKILEELVAVKGIGNWTAEMFLMFSLGRPDIFPVDDLGIRRGVEKLLKRQVSSQQLEKIGLRWKPFRTVAAWYVWKAVDG